MFKKIIGWLAAAVLTVGAFISYFFSTRKRNVGLGNIDRIGSELDGEAERLERERAALEYEGGLVDAERADIEREGNAIDGARTILDRDKELIAELKKRSKK